MVCSKLQQSVQLLCIYPGLAKKGRTAMLRALHASRTEQRELGNPR